jgi:hypothetical protein
LKIAEEFGQTSIASDEHAEVLAALTEQGVGATLDGIGTQAPVQAEFLTRGTEQGEERRGGGEDEAQAVTAGSVAHARQAATKAESRVLFVAEILLTGESTRSAWRATSILRTSPSRRGRWLQAIPGTIVLVVVIGVKTRCAKPCGNLNYWTAPCSFSRPVDEARIHEYLHDATK